MGKPAVTPKELGTTFNVVGSGGGSGIGTPSDTGPHAQMFPNTRQYVTVYDKITGEFQLRTVDAREYVASGSYSYTAP